jgi:hypothetical protein
VTRSDVHNLLLETMRYKSVNGRNFSVTRKEFDHLPETQKEMHTYYLPTLALIETLSVNSRHTNRVKPIQRIPGILFPGVTIH